ncbi:MAG: hypothetical protein JXR86_02335 [Spirochaetales bacterium]|nr:hypothetical protein [Spirochaetales bacterium]
MKLGDLIYSIITLVLMVLFIAGPVLRKLLRSEGTFRHNGVTPSEDSAYGTVDSARVVERMSVHHDTGEQWEFSEPSAGLSPTVPAEINPLPARERIESLPPLKKALIWSEILGKPTALRDFEE